MRLFSGPPPSRLEFENLYRENAPRLNYLLWNIIRNRQRVEEVIQEPFFKFYKNDSRWDPSLPLWPYLRTIAMNTLFSSMKKERETVPWEDAQEHTPALPDSDPALHDLVERLFAALPESQRTVLILKKVEGLSQREIAQSLKISEKAVESLLSRATSNLLKHYPEGTKDSSPFGSTMDRMKNHEP